jgi:hypothetical protein
MGKPSTGTGKDSKAVDLPIGSMKEYGHQVRSHERHTIEPMLLRLLNEGLVTCSMHLKGDLVNMLTS